LFLDELTLFSPFVLDTLREPIQEGRIASARAGMSATYLARFTLVAAINPCPSGPSRRPSAVPDRPCVGVAQ